MARVSNFEDQEYWNKRYSSARSTEQFDWYLVNYAMIRSHLLNALTSTPAAAIEAAHVGVLDLGCGNSKLLFDMASDPEISAPIAARIVSAAQSSHARALLYLGVDYSPIAVARQRELIKLTLATKLEEISQLVKVIDFAEADARKLKPLVDDASVFCVVDKATLDCVDCSGHEDDAEQVVREVVRILVQNGLFVIVTCRPVARRLQTIAGVPGVTVEGVVSLENDPVSPSHVIIIRKL